MRLFLFIVPLVVVPAMWYFFHRLKEYSDTQKILNAPRVLDGDRHHIKQLEHELGILPCSDAECESCTGVSKRVRYDPALDSYHLTTGEGMI